MPSRNVRGSVWGRTARPCSAGVELVSPPKDQPFELTAPARVDADAERLEGELNSCSTERTCNPAGTRAGAFYDPDRPPRLLFPVPDGIYMHRRCSGQVAL